MPSLNICPGLLKNSVVFDQNGAISARGKYNFRLGTNKGLLERDYVKACSDPIPMKKIDASMRTRYQKLVLTLRLLNLEYSHVNSTSLKKKQMKVSSDFACLTPSFDILILKDVEKITEEIDQIKARSKQAASLSAAASVATESSSSSSAATDETPDDWESLL